MSHSVESEEDGVFFFGGKGEEKEINGTNIKNKKVVLIQESGNTVR